MDLLADLAVHHTLLCTSLATVLKIENSVLKVEFWYTIIWLKYVWNSVFKTELSIFVFCVCHYSCLYFCVPAFFWDTLYVFIHKYSQLPRLMSFSPILSRLCIIQPLLCGINFYSLFILHKLTDIPCYNKIHIYMTSKLKHVNIAINVFVRFELQICVRSWPSVHVLLCICQAGGVGNILLIFEFFVRFSVGLRWILQIPLFKF